MVIFDPPPFPSWVDRVSKYRDKAAVPREQDVLHPRLAATHAGAPRRNRWYGPTISLVYLGVRTD